MDLTERFCRVMTDYISKNPGSTGLRRATSVSRSAEISRSLLDVPRATARKKGHWRPTETANTADSLPAEHLWVFASSLVPSVSQRNLDR